MKKVNKKTLRTAALVAAAVCTAVACRPLARSMTQRDADLFFQFLRTFIYVGLFAAWGMSVRRRVIQTDTRRCLIAVAYLAVFWMVLREVKFRFAQGETLLRCLWYAYYIPLLMIPLLALLCALTTVTRGDKHRRAAPILWSVTVAAILLVLTNDLHGLVFVFPEGGVWSESAYSYGTGYFAVAAWGVICALAAVVIMLEKCRLPRGGLLLHLPLVPLGAALCYAVLYALGVPLMRSVLGDLAAFNCLAFVGFFESCIDCGLIASNTRYGELFASARDCPMQIVDHDFNVRYRSASAPTLTKDTMRAALAAPQDMGGGRIVRAMPINGGCAVWCEDLGELISLRGKLSDLHEELTERNALLKYEYEKEKERRTVEEQNRIYDIVQNKTQAHLDEIDRLVNRYKTASDAEKNAILSRIIVLGSFIKRRRDLALSHYADGEIAAERLYSAYAESLHALSRIGIRGGALVDTGREREDGAALALAYDFFDDVVNTVCGGANFINVAVSRANGRLRVSVRTDCTDSKPGIFEKYPSMGFECDEDGSVFTLFIGGGEGE